MAQASTIGELRQAEYRVLSVKEELRKNLVTRIRSGEELFPGIVGFEDTVLPQIENAILSGQDIILLGERGQAKTRLIRALVGLLDPEIPIIAGCEINDSPYDPTCRPCKERVAVEGDLTPIEWMGRERRYGEKLATPDITIADLIGEVDPIKVAEGRYLSDEFTIHYGLIPRTNRGIFCINELPDLSERIQVGMFNIMEERDVQIKGYKVQLPLDLFLIASANPEDYTNRGRIITPLKDRFGAQIRTHYPKIMEHRDHDHGCGTGADHGRRCRADRTAVHERGRGGVHKPCSQERGREPALRRERPRVHRQLRDNLLQRSSTRPPPEGKGRRAARQRYGLFPDLDGRQG